MNMWKKIFFAASATILIFSLLIIFFTNFPQENIYKKNEVKNEVSQKILEELENCRLKYDIKQNTDCFKNYFEKYTFAQEEKPLEQAISLYKNLVSKNIAFEENCHYIFHGIGYGIYEKNKNELEKIFSIKMNSDPFVDLPPTCPNGFFHGVMEEVIKDKGMQTIHNICENLTNNKIDCFHGLGHGFYSYFEYDETQSIKKCENVTGDIEMQSMCRTGVFMEMLRNRATTTTEKMLTFAACENLPIKYQGECFNQHSYLLAEFGTKKKEFTENLLACRKQFPPEIKTQQNTLDRISCVRLFKF